MKSVDIRSPEGQEFMTDLAGVHGRESEIEIAMQSYDEAWSEGRAAFHAGYLEVNNPYSANTKEFECWLDGWADGEEDASQPIRGLQSFEHHGKVNLAETIKRASPVAWQSINLKGKYLFGQTGEAPDIEYLMASISEYVPLSEK